MTSNGSANTSTLSPIVPITIKDDESLTSDDAAWALNCAFLILTMQTGFAMLECGSVSSKNSASIMVKNCVDVTVGGLSYWVFGYGLSFGDAHPNRFVGIGKWFFTVPETNPRWGSEYSHYFFHFSFASTATTIVSGAVAERMNFMAYMVFASYNTIIYCIPAYWAWNSDGWLAQRGFFDFAGTCIVHYGGGVSAFVAAYMVGPRTNRFDVKGAYTMSSPMTAISGMFMLWWAWMGFNAGSTFGIAGNLWKVSALAAVTTLNAGIGGGVVGIILSMSLNRGRLMIGDTVNAILGALVSITGICPIATPFESLVIGAIGAFIAVLAVPFVNYLKVDDPVGAVSVHCFAAIWGTLCVGIFAKDVTNQKLAANGLLHGGGWELLLTQALGLLAVTAWASTTTFIGMFVLDKTIGIRNKLDEEILGADWCQHELFDQGWCHELYSYVINKLKHGDINEAVAEKIVKQMRKQLTPQMIERMSRLSAIPQRKISFFVPDSGSTESEETPRPEDPSLPARTSPRQPQSNWATLARIVRSQPSPKPLPRRRILGALNAPLYQSFKSDLEQEIIRRQVASRGSGQQIPPNVLIDPEEMINKIIETTMAEGRTTPSKKEI